MFVIYFFLVLFFIFIINDNTLTTSFYIHRLIKSFKFIDSINNDYYSILTAVPRRKGNSVLDPIATEVTSSNKNNNVIIDVSPITRIQIAGDRYIVPGFYIF